MIIHSSKNDNICLYTKTRKTIIHFKNWWLGAIYQILTVAHRVIRYFDILTGVSNCPSSWEYIYIDSLERYFFKWCSKFPKPWVSQSWDSFTVGIRRIWTKQRKQRWLVKPTNQRWDWTNKSWGLATAEDIVSVISMDKIHLIHLIWLIWNTQNSGKLNMFNHFLRFLYTNPRVPFPLKAIYPMIG